MVGAPAVVLLSGGLDSSTVAHYVKGQGHEIYAMTFRYGQRHSVEIAAAERVAKSVGAAHHLVVDFNLSAIGGSALTSDIPVPHDGDPTAGEIPVTYVPARNTIFLSFALAWAEVLEAQDIYIGANAIDYSGYPDCRPEYLCAYEKMANLATAAGVTGKSRLRIHAPLLNKSKAEIVEVGRDLGVDFSLTHSCYDPDPSGLACGSCDSCLLRRRGFSEAGIEDPVQYAA